MTSYDETVAALWRQWDEVLDWLARLPATAWPAPSVLAGWTVAELAHHVAVSARAVIDALDEPRPGGRPLTIAAYTAAWAAAAEQIAERSRSAAGDLDSATLLALHRGEQQALRGALDATGDDPVIAARRGPIRLSDFLATRLDELVVHALDLSRSVPDVPAVRLDPAALRVAARMLAGVLVERAPGKAVELRIPPYVAVQCVEGPRHTRGTPPNVVETDPVSWLELASGRLAWADALRTSRLHASGERADLSTYLPLLR